MFLTMLVLGMTYAYFDLKTGGETESTMNIGGAEISATYSFSNSINITDVLPGNDVIAYKDITLTYKNTSSEEYKVYLKAVIDYSTFTNAIMIFIVEQIIRLLFKIKLFSQQLQVEKQY